MELIPRCVDIDEITTVVRRNREICQLFLGELESR